MNKKELAKAADNFLRAHDDTYFKSGKKRHKRKVEYPYLSYRQWQNRLATEIPASNLSKNQQDSCAKMQDCFDVYDRE